MLNDSKKYCTERGGFNYFRNFSLLSNVFMLKVSASFTASNPMAQLPSNFENRTTPASLISQAIVSQYLENLNSIGLNASFLAMGLGITDIFFGIYYLNEELVI